ncbi:MAG: hypothetical protein WB757_06785 [Candidatus Cybelea sp.]|jgi:hypothetical protein
MPLVTSPDDSLVQNPEQLDGGRTGKRGDGTVFSVTPSGIEAVLYSFSGGSDGKNPESGLIDVNGTLYGTTPYGGGSGPKTGGTSIRSRCER